MLNSYVTFDPFMPIDPNMRQYRGAASSLVLGTFEPLGPKEGLSILFRHTQCLVIKAFCTTTFCGNTELSEQNE